LRGHPAAPGHPETTPENPRRCQLLRWKKAAYAACLTVGLRSK
jgi:hypothetical protein